MCCNNCPSAMTIYDNVFLLTPRRHFTFGQGAIAPNLDLAPKCNMKHCLTKSKHRHIGAKRKYCGLQNTPKCVSGRGSARTPLGDHDTSQTPLSAGCLDLGHCTHVITFGWMTQNNRSKTARIIYNSSLIFPSHCRNADK